MKEYEKITQGVYRIIGKRSNSYLVEDESLVLIDTGMPGDDTIILDTIRTIGLTPGDLKYIFITHAHLDHVGSLAAVQAATGAQIVSSKYEQDHVEGRKMLCSMRREGVGGKIFKALLFIMEKFIVKYQPANVDIAVPDSGIGVGIAGLQIIETPGHSAGSLSFYHEGKKILITGDALSGDPSLRLPPMAGCSSYEQALRSVKQLTEFDYGICLFGHGAPSMDMADSHVKLLI